MKVLAPYDLWGLLKRALRGWIDDAAPSMGASLAFYTLFSLAPLLLVVIAIAGLFMGRGEAQALLITQLTQLIGDKAALGVESLLDAAGTREEGVVPAISGTVMLLVGATTVFAELRSDLSRIWRAQTAKAKGMWDFVRTRLIAFAMVTAVGFLLLASLGVSAVLSAVGSRWFASSQLLAHAIEFATSFVVLTGLFAMIYKVLPSRRIAWADVWVGAAVTAALFWIGKFLFGMYLGKAAIGSTFGAAQTLVVIVMWVYYSAQVFFLGAEFTREYALRHGSMRNATPDFDRRRHPDDGPPAANDELAVATRGSEIRGSDSRTGDPDRRRHE